MKNRFSDRINVFGKNIVREKTRSRPPPNEVQSITRTTPDFPTPQPIIEAVKTALEEEPWKYAPNEGLLELREAIAEKLQKENNITADPTSEILVTVGGTEALYSIMQTFLNPGDEVIVADPDYNYETFIPLAGGIPVTVPLKEADEFQIDPQTIEKKISSRTKLIALTNPHFPTGALLSKAYLTQIADLAIKHDLLVLCDELYEKLVYDGNKTISIASIPGMENRTITVHGFSKAYVMMGFRVGYLTADKELVAPIKRIHQNIVISATTLSQRAAIAAYKDPKVAQIIQARVEKIQKRRDMIVQRFNEFPKIHCFKPKGCVNAFPNIKEWKMSSYDFAMRLMNDSKVFVQPGTAFGKGGEGHIRISILHSFDEITEATNKIQQTLDKWESPET